ncbi:MAG: hypothetical protein D6696_04580, partial [Acidobacteria bacterium]
AQPAAPAPPPAAAAGASRRRRRRQPAPRFIELNEEDRALLYAQGTEEGEASPEARLAACAEALQKADIRDEIADLVLDFCAPYLSRRLLLFRRRKRILGWRGEGRDLSFVAVRGIEIAEDQPSVFQNVGRGLGVWRGPLPPFPAHQSLLLALGEPPKECIVLPIALGERVVCYLYGDNGGEELGEVPVEVLKRLARKAAVAFELLILKNKIRML